MNDLAAVKHREVMQAAAHRVAAELIGSHRSLYSCTTDDEREDADFLAALNEQCFQCSGCSWWFEIELMGSADQCIECDAVDED